MRSSFRRYALGFAAAIASLILASGSAVTATGSPRNIPTATTSAGSSMVGVIFPAGGTQHGCTASVINSYTGDLVLTAAHCVSGTAVGWTFAPGWRAGSAPEGRWTVTAAYALPGWLKDQDPQQDMAVLKVAPRVINGRPRTLQSVTGAADIGTAPRGGQQILDIAYNNNDDTPIGCTTTTYWTTGHPSFDCHGYVGGSSGSPWLVTTGDRPQVVGIIGGLYQGGCAEYTSYSSAFGDNIVSLWLRAEAALHGDKLPAPDPDGC